MTVRFRARIARTATRTPQHYDRGPEYRDSSQVFDSASLATLNGLRITVGHSDMTAVGRIVPGSAGREQHSDGETYLTALLEVSEATAARIRSGELRGISMGYACEHAIDASGRRWQTQIRHDHCALLRRDVETPRCGDHCSIQDNMTTRHSDALQLDGCNCGAQHTDATTMLDSANGVIPDGSVAAMLDAAASQAGVTRQTIVDHLMRSVGGRVHLTFDHLRAATFECSLHGGKLLRGVQSDAGATVANDADDGSDESFRRMLSRKLGG
jgi:hypothetical protein